MTVPDIAVDIAPEVIPRSRAPRKAPTANKTGRSPARPYKKLPQDTLVARITKLTTRVERAKRQHATAQELLLKYAREKAFRETQAVEAEPEPEKK